MRKISSQCNNNPILASIYKSPYPVRDLYDGHIFDLKTRVNIGLRMNLVSVEYGKLSHMFHLIIWFFSLLPRFTSYGMV